MQFKELGMKKGFLPFGLFLIFIVLGSMTYGFISGNGAQEYVPRTILPQTKLNEIKPAAAHLAMIKNNQHTGLISPADLKLQQKELEDLTQSRAEDMNWIQLGPDNFGGRTRAILFDNQTPDHTVVYAAGVTGGIWRSTNLGTTWKKINMETYNLNATCMTQTPNGDIYVGTGESFNAQTVSGLQQMGYSSGFMGQGIFKSVDGINFSLLPSTQPEFNDMNSDWAYINELANDQINSRIYAATNTGLKYSNDGGTTWATAKDADGNELTKNSLDVQVGFEGNVVACIDNKGYVSPSGDVNQFKLVSTGDSVSLPAIDVTRIEFAIAPSDANVVYASVVNALGNVKNIYRSNDMGQTWRIILPGTPSIVIFNEQGVYNNALAVFPDNPDKILLGGIDMWQGQMIQAEGFYDWKSVSESVTVPLFPTYLHEDHHVYRFVPGASNQFIVGTDGGVFLGTRSGQQYAYQISNRNYFTTQFYALGMSGIRDYVIGGSQDNGTILIPGQNSGNTNEIGFQILPGEGGPAAISIINPGAIVVSSTAGDFRRSADFGATYSIPDNFPNTVGNPQAFRTPLTLVENFNNYYSNDSVWYYADQDVTAGETVMVRSHNAGQPFQYVIPNGVSLSAGDSLRVQDIVTSYLYVGVANSIYFTKDFLQFDKPVDWFEISNSDFGMSGTPYSMAVSGDGNHMYVGTLNGKLYRISNLAEANDSIKADVESPGCIVSTQPVKIYVPGTTDEISQVITSVAFDPQNPNRVMITLGNYGNDSYILFSENALAQTPVFSSRQGNLPHMPVYSGIIEMMNNNMAIVGTEHGVYLTENINASSPQWNKQMMDMGSVPVFQLTQQLIDQPKITIKVVLGNETSYIEYPGTNNWGSIYAATYGRGLFRSDAFYQVGTDEKYLSEGNKQNDKLKIYPNPASDIANIEFESDQNREVTASVYDLTGRMVKTQMYSALKGDNNIELQLDGLKKGTYIVQLVSGSKSFSEKLIIN